jgi:hypothetical protein
MKTSFITEKLKDNQDNQYFLKDIENKKSKNKHILDEKIKKVEISNKDRIILPIIIDTEYTASLGNIENLT